jgi:uncharacterized membrane protein YdbT with pleckstrin-like domain
VDKEYGMGISPKLLGDGERVVVSTRTHAKALVLPIVVFIVISGIAGFLSAMASGETWLMWIVAAVALVAMVMWVLRPFLVWLTASYTVTDRRLITRRGVFTRVGHDLPLRRINDVSYERHLLDRLLGCGTLVISAASERGQIRLPDVPNVEQLHLTITELLFGDDGHSASDGGVDGGFGGGRDRDTDPRRR